MKNIYIFALAAHGHGISGGDRIFMEFAKSWSKNSPVKIFVWEEGYQMCLRHKLQITNIKFQISNLKFWNKFGFIVGYIIRIVEGIRLGLALKIEDNSKTIVYCASEFWMDSLSAFILKLRYPNIKWAAAWYQSAPNPLKGFNEGKRVNKYYLSSFLYWLVQLPIKSLINKYADLILVNNPLEVKKFLNLRKSQKIMVVLGALDLEKIKQYRKKYQKTEKKYEAVFQGRFHPQKGILELIDIWKKVVEKKPKARLAMIGDGPLMKSAKLKIKSEKLERNIELYGYVFDGPLKYKIFAQSRIVLHPSFYDSGGMASAEAMAFGLPAIGFDLKSYKSYYPKGMVKVRTGDLDRFAGEIINLLSDNKKYKHIAQEALDMIQINWSFQTRAEEVMKELN